MALFMVLNWGKERKRGKEKVLLLISTSKLCSSLWATAQSQGTEIPHHSTYVSPSTVTGKAGYYRSWECLKSELFVTA